MWVFGYGSLIWRPGFSFKESQLASLEGYDRRFCQASHDHRGTPEQPGRVVTLVRNENAVCVGMAFEIVEDVAAILGQLEIREQDGYEQCSITLRLAEGRQVPAITWVAQEGNSSWRGGESLAEVAKLIATRSGPSGSNYSYLMELHKALVRLHIVDQGIEELVARVSTYLDR